MDTQQETMISKFEKWIDSPEGLLAINQSGGNTSMNNVYAGTCSHSLASASYIAGFKEGCKKDKSQK